MKIGISTSVDTNNYHWDRLLTLIDHGFQYIELKNKRTPTRLKDIELLLDLKKKHDLKYSVHSLTQDLFCNDQDVSQGNQSFLKAEIKLASLIGASRVIIHAGKKEELTANELKKLQELSDFAILHNVTLCLENSSSKGANSEEHIIDVIDQIKGLQLCLDIGHLNLAINRGQIKDLNSFLKNSKDKIAQFHIHSNDGQKDQHIALNAAGKKLLKKIFGIMDKEQTSLIIETKNLKQALETRNKLVQD